MFSKQSSQKSAPSGVPADKGARSEGAAAILASTAPTPAKTPSLLANDLTIKGNISTTGDLRVDGTVEGDIRANLLTVGENAEIRGEVVVDDAVIGGKIKGRVRGIKVRLTSTAKVEGDIVHSLFAVEAGAQFQGAVVRDENPVGDSAKKAPPSKPSYPAGDSGAGAAPSGVPPKDPAD